MLTLEYYLQSAPDAAGMVAAALAADMNDHAMTGACLMLDELAAKQDAAGHVVEATVMRQAMRWLQAETEAHRKVADELGARAAGDTFAGMRRSRRATMTASPEAMRPLFALTRRFLHLALKRAALDEADRLLGTGLPEGVTVAGHVLDFLAANEPGGADDAG